MEDTRKGEYGFTCPGRPGSGGCDSARQGKVKLFVNPDQNRFHCWVCGFGNRSSLAQLMVRNSAEQREYLDSIGLSAKSHVSEHKPLCTTLPAGFIPFGLGDKRDEAPYLSYLKGRGLSERTVVLYRMGYTVAGPLTGRVIVPSFDAFGMVNFWSARTIHPDVRPGYVLPEASKDIISNEHTVDWEQPVYLVEGIFDEIAIGSQAIALYGKFLQSALALRFVERRPPMIYVCLDSDARRAALELVERLIGYDVQCSLLDLAGKDPGEIGMAGVDAAVLASRPVTGSAGLVATKGRL